VTCVLNPALGRAPAFHRLSNLVRYREHRAGQELQPELLPRGLTSRPLMVSRPETQAVMLLP
jgi:hypothetical protein